MLEKDLILKKNDVIYHKSAQLLFFKTKDERKIKLKSELLIDKGGFLGF